LTGRSTACDGGVGCAISARALLEVAPLATSAQPPSTSQSETVSTHCSAPKAPFHYHTLILHKHRTSNGHENGLEAHSSFLTDAPASARTRPVSLYACCCPGT
jgi:hypothetical protein